MGRRRLPTLTKDQLVKCLEHDGWYWWTDPQGGRQRHLAMKHPVKRTKVTISHNAKEFGPRSDNLRSILVQAGLTRARLTEIYFGIYG